MIEARNLTMVYGNGKKATDDVSFTVKAGEIVGFAGPNGAGKTTVIKLLTGILKPTSGTAVINGFDINKDPIKAKMSFAYIADNPDILIQLTGLEYLNFIADMYEIPEDAREKIFRKFYQTDESHATEGNGVGLAVVKKIIDLHRGTISVDCLNGRTTFSVSIPSGLQ